MPPPDKNRYAKNPMNVCRSRLQRNGLYLKIVVLDALFSIICVAHQGASLEFSGFDPCDGPRERECSLAASNAFGLAGRDRGKVSVTQV